MKRMSQVVSGSTVPKREACPLPSLGQLLACFPPWRWMGWEVWGSALICLAPHEGPSENSHLWLLEESMPAGGPVCPTRGTKAPGLWAEPCKDLEATPVGWHGLRREGCGRAIFSNFLVFISLYDPLISFIFICFPLHIHHIFLLQSSPSLQERGPG